MGELDDIAAIEDADERARAISRAIAGHQALVAELAAMWRRAVPEAGASPGFRPQVRRSLPTPPDVRRSASLFVAEAEEQGIRPGRRMLGVDVENAPGHIAACLRIEPGDKVIARRKVLLANDLPVRIATSFFRADLFGRTRLAEPDFVRPSLQSAIKALGHEFGRSEETLVARPAEPDEAEILRLDPGEWVVRIVRAGYSAEDLPIHVLETICAATRHVFDIAQPEGADEF